MALSRPRLFWQVAFNAHPNDRFAVPIWSDLSHMYKRIEGPYSSGSQYELALAQASQPSIRWFDPNEYLNPANTGSPYSPNVLPYRKLLGQAVYPADGAGNLLNVNSWRPNDLDVYDPSFESYANGAALPDWIAAVGGVTGSITTTNPQQGTKSATYTVAGTVTPQGLTWEVPCVPGQQYTSSAYVRQSSASIQWLKVDDQTLSRNSFGTSASNGWGNDDLGNAYTTSGGSASDYSVSGGVGRHSVGTLNVRRFTVVSSGIVNFDQTVTFTVPAVITGGASDYLLIGVAARYTSTSNYYQAGIRFKTDLSMQLVIDEWVGGVQSTLATYTLPMSYVAGTSMSIRFQGEDLALRTRAWTGAGFEPNSWQIDITDTSHGGEGSIAYNTFATSGVTNTLPLVATFDDTMVVGSTVSSSTTTTGSYVRLSKTFTASQPTHTITVSTAGTAIAGTVNIDAIQHEIGSSATAFTTTGAIISPFMEGFVERWPREYEDQGFTGFSVTPVIDALAVANVMTLDSEYGSAVLATNPSYLYRLDDGLGSASAQESSGNQGPPLSAIVSKTGAGTAPAFGGAVEVAGLPGASGVIFSPPQEASPLNDGTILGTGNNVGGGVDIDFPGSLSGAGITSWGASMACWVKAESSPHDPALGSKSLIYTYNYDGSFNDFFVPLAIFLDVTGEPGAATQSLNGVAPTAWSPTSIFDDGLFHHIVGTVSQVSGGNTVVRIYVDGVLKATNTVTTASLGGVYTLDAPNLTLAGIAAYSQMFNGLKGTMLYASLWSRELSATEVTTLWTAGGLGYAGELTGARLERRLRSNNYGGKLRISTGSSGMQPVSSANVDGLSEIHNITNVEGGKSWTAADGALVFEGRQQRWLRLIPRGVFGEDEVGGEIPYLEGIQFDLDPMFVFADVRVQRVNGTTAYGGTVAQRALAARKYFPRSAPQDTGDYENDQDAQYKADWVFATHKEPLLRVSVITLDPSSNPDLWTTILNLQNSQRWTVKRRAKAANAGAGITISGDYFIEQVTHNGLDMDNDRWTVSMFLSPIGVITTSPGVSFQPWILGDVTHGVLGSTTALGW